MALQNSFANETTPNMQELDQNFANLGAISYVPCTASGTNSITLTPRSNTPAINGYSQMQGYPFVAVGTNTGSVQIQVLSPSGSPLTQLQAYKLTAAGPAALTGGEIQITGYYIPIYDAALNSGAGGFHILNVIGGITSTAAQNTVYAGPTSSTPTAPVFRRLVGADLPNPAVTTLGGVLASQSQVSRFVTAILTSGQPITAQVFYSDIGGTQSPASLPLPTVTTLGGVLALNSSLNQFVVAIAGSGQPQTSQVFFSNLGGAIGVPQFPASGAVAGTYGSGTSIPVVTVDVAGRITTIATVAVNNSGTVGTGTTITAGNALSGGGDLSVSRTIALAYIPGLITGTFGSNTSAAIVTINSGGQVTTIATTSGSLAHLELTQTYTRSQAGVVTQLSGTSIVIDWRVSNNWALTLTSGTTFLQPIGVPQGMSGIIAATQSSSGNCALTINGNYKTLSGSGVTLSSGANQLDLLAVYAMTSSSVYITANRNIS